MSVWGDDFGFDEVALLWRHEPGVGEENDFEAGEVYFADVVEMDGFDGGTGFVECRDGAVDGERVGEFVCALDGAGVVENLCIEDCQHVSGRLVGLGVVGVEDLMELGDLSH